MSDEDLIDPEQTSIFGDEYASWYSEWQGMPEFVQDDLSSYQAVVVHFANSRDVAEFAKLVDQPITPRTRSLWFPKAEIGRMADKRYADEP